MGTERRALMLELGNPAIILLLAYMLTLPGIVLEFFMLKSLWYFGFEWYSIYIFFLATGCVFAGFYMIFRRSDAGKLTFSVDRPPVFAFAVSTAAVALFLLIVFGKEIAELAILLSIIIVASVIVAISSAPGMNRHDILPVMFYGAGIVTVSLVPVHQAFQIWGGTRGVLEFALLDGIFVVVGISIAFIALNAVKSQKGLFSCWLLGAIIITLIAFHELIGIVSSSSFEIYDQVLALEGAIFSIVPLSLYFVREFQSARLWTHLMNAKSMLDRKNYEQGLIEVESAMELLSRSGQSNKLSLPWSLYGDIYYAMGRINRAGTCYDMALRIDPHDPETWSNLGNMLAVRGQQDRALAAFQKATSLAPNDPKIWNNLGVVFLSMKRYDDALAAFEKAIDRDSAFPLPYYNAGMILQRSGKPAAAMRMMEQLVQLAPEDEGFRRAYEKAGVILDYFQQAAGWKLLDADVSGMVEVLLKEPGNFEERYREFLEEATRDLSQRAFGGDREHAMRVAREMMAGLGKDGEGVAKLRMNSRFTLDQMRFGVAVLILANKARFRTVDKEVRLISLDIPKTVERGDGIPVRRGTGQIHNASVT